MPALLSILVLALSAAAVTLRSTERAFLMIYLPVLMLIPDGYAWGNPALTLYEYAVIPIGIGLIFQMFQRAQWRWSIIDACVIAYLAWTLVSQIHTNGRTDLFNRIVHLITLNVFPYMIGKLLIEQNGLAYTLIKRIVLFVVIPCSFCIFEFRLGINPLRHLFNAIFPGQDPWPTQLRYGFGRASGTFGHAILLGTVVGISLLLNRYLSRFELWGPSKANFLSRRGIKIPHLIGAVLAASSVMTLSRGPWIATFIGFVVMSIGTAKDRWAGLRRTLMILIAAGAGVYFGALVYSNFSHERVSEEDVASALYRVRLLTEYREIADVRSLWGWGDQQWPKVKGMSSIDNWYLLEFLTYGLPGLYLFIAMLAIPAIRMMTVGLTDTALSPEARALFFVHVGIIALIAVSVSTVFLGSQLFPLFFLFAGWGDSCVLNRARPVLLVPTFEFTPLVAEG